MVETLRVIQPGQRRIKIFIDFWNVVINARNQSKRFDVSVHWDKLVQHIVANTKQGYSDESHDELAGCYIFGSKTQSNPIEKKFVDRVLDEYGSHAGLFFNFTERKPKQSGAICQSCGEQLKTTSESGVDVLLSVEMIKHAAMREHEYLGLVSNDRDFVPLLSFLRDQGHRVMHVATGLPDREMRAITWSQIGLQQAYPSISAIDHDDWIILTAPPYENELKELIAKCPIDQDKIRILDICERNEIHDTDLKFLITGLSLHWQKPGLLSRSFPIARVSDNLNQFRKDVAARELVGPLPCVVYSGRTILNFHGTSGARWMLSVTRQATPKDARIWHAALNS